MASQGNQPPQSNTSLPELLGSNHWSGLLDPLDQSLRGLILLCGDLCQVTYDSFNSDPHSKYTGSCRYSKTTLLEKVVFPVASDLTISAYLFATSEVSMPEEFLLFSLSNDAWSKESNWMGYVAISSPSPSTGRRVIYVVWRGTIRTLEWVDVLHPLQVSIRNILPSSSKDLSDDSKEDLKVMKGWYTIYTSRNPNSPFSKLSARDQLLYAIKELITRYKDEGELSIVCTGHSLGAALATLCAFDIVESGLAKIDEKTNIQVTSIVFGSPQVGNKEFKERMEVHKNLRVLHVKNKPDVIPLYPTGILGYVNVGTELLIDSKKSPYLKESTTNVGDYHNLQGILHTVAGWNGEKGEFKLQVKRSIALVNKSSEYLKDELLVPGSWWVEKNKGMILGVDGEWQLQTPADEDLPVPPPEGKADMEPNFGNGLAKNVEQENKKKSGLKLGPFACCFKVV
ncbi:alpha/beta-Hydrolases superfamily protein [Rhynchospora pubera]|uniref:Phospholipase A1 n=1 Tax=Rhynchospora pubera TaxID=906938 RepID=A0AAV8GVW2_9POAL|nr:alpha/beta-Hydrolases superfamily protein [Rhynchospora pubera]